MVNFVLRERFRSTAARAEGRAATEGGYAGSLGDVTRLMIGKDGRTSINLRAEGNSKLKESGRDIALEPLPGNPVLDPREARTLIGESRLFRGTLTHNRTILGNVSATLNGELSHSEANLCSFSDLRRRVVDPDRHRPASTGQQDRQRAWRLFFNGDKGSWRLSATGNADISRSVTETDPDAPIADLKGDRVRSTTTSGGVDATANGPLFKLPAGDASTTLRVNASTLDLNSKRRRELITTSNSLDRTDAGASINLDPPISRVGTAISARLAISR